MDGIHGNCCWQDLQVTKDDDARLYGKGRQRSALFLRSYREASPLVRRSPRPVSGSPDVDRTHGRAARAPRSGKHDVAEIDAEIRAVLTETGTG